MEIVPHHQHQQATPEDEVQQVCKAEGYDEQHVTQPSVSTTQQRPYSGSEMEEASPLETDLLVEQVALVHCRKSSLHRWSPVDLLRGHGMAIHNYDVIRIVSIAPDRFCGYTVIV